jgi:hypothetical protein
MVLKSVLTIAYRIELIPDYYTIRGTPPQAIPQGRINANHFDLFLFLESATIVASGYLVLKGLSFADCGRYTM